MNQSAFERMREDIWASFAIELDSFQKVAVQRESSNTSREKFMQDFETISRDLAISKARGYSIELIERLNELVTRGHYVIHTSQTNRIAKVREFFVAGFAREVRSARYFVLVATISFVLPGIIIGAMMHHTPRYVYSVLSPAEVQSLERMYDESQNRIGRERTSSSDIYMFGFYIFNNVQIGLRVFATGLVFCVASILVLGFNGLVISAVINHLILIGSGTTILSFVAGHSAFELTAIVLSGAAGIMLGYVLIHPGELSRREALRQTGLKSVKIMAGAVLMLIVAAFIEAFWSSIRLVPSEIKYLFGGILWIFTFSYFLFAGKNADRSITHSS